MKPKSAEVMLTVMVALVVAGITAIVGYTLHRAEQVQHDLASHERAAGHAANVQRIEGIRETLAEIRKDINAIRRSVERGSRGDNRG